MKPAQLPKVSMHWEKKYVGEETLPLEFAAFSIHKLYVDTLAKSGDIEKNPGPRLVLDQIVILFMICKHVFQGNAR